MRLIAIALLFASAAVARADEAPPLPEMIGVTAQASSTLVSGKKTYEARFVLSPDAKHAQFWCEGKADEGIGESLVMTFTAPARIQSLVIEGGVWRDAALFRANNIPTQLELTTDDGRTKRVTLPEERNDVTVELGGAAVKSIKLAIGAVKKGKMNDTCLSAVELVAANPDTAILDGVGAAELPALRDTYAKLFSALESCDDEATLRDHVKLPLASETTYDKHTYSTFKSLLAACKAGRFTDFQMVDPKVSSDGPGAIDIVGYPAYWKLALVDGSWKLTAITDGTP